MTASWKNRQSEALTDTGCRRESWQMELVIVSGRSGAGKSVALRAMEDIGYYCVDNLPVAMLSSLIAECISKFKKIAVSIDVRNLPGDGLSITQILNGIKATFKVHITIMFLDADDDILIKRYSDTRRIHPLTQRGNLTLEQAIKHETSLLAPLSSNTDLRIDTGTLSIHDLTKIIIERLQGKVEKDIVMVFESFGFKYGVPHDADFIFDTRFLPNPYWIPELRPYSGLDQPVIDYLSTQEEVSAYINQIFNFLRNWLPMIERSSRSYLTVALGCTGGYHRSVYTAEQLAKRFRDYNKVVQVRHLTLEKLQKS